MNKYLYWTPRILTLLFILFIGMFSFDVFGEYQSWELLLAFFMHNIPTLVLIGILFVAWRWERVGGIIFILIAIVFTIFFKTYTHILSLLTISGIPLIIGILFLLNKGVKK